MKYWSIFLAVFALVGCNRGAESQEAVRQGVIDYLSGRTNLNVNQMNITVNSVVFRGNEADAVVAFAPKGSAPGQGMQMRYTLERQGSRWVVKGRADSGKNPHGGMAPGAANPHGAPSEMPPGHPPVENNKK